MWTISPSQEGPGLSGLFGKSRTTSDEAIQSDKLAQFKWRLSQIALSSSSGVKGSHSGLFPQLWRKEFKVK